MPVNDLLDPVCADAKTKPTDGCPYSVISYFDGFDESWIWITWKRKKVIFLPQQYRPALDGASAHVQGYTVVISRMGIRQGFYPLDLWRL